VANVAHRNGDAATVQRMASLYGQHPSQCVRWRGPGRGWR
jgi:hypothetical protein